MTDFKHTGGDHEDRAGRLREAQNEPARGMASCLDPETLVTYVYGDATAAERTRVDEHLARCESCAGELAALGGTREQLRAWTPPERELGFRITAAADVHERPPDTPVATVLRPARWWARPLPAWAQAAAAAVIFASGLAIGAARQTGTTHAVQTTASGESTTSSPAALQRASSASIGATAAPASATAPVSSAELARLEQRLRAEFAAQANAGAAATGFVATRAGDSSGTDVLLQQVRALVAESEQRQQRRMAQYVLDLSRDFDHQRSSDLRLIEERIGTSERMTNDGLNYLLKTGLTIR